MSVAGSWTIVSTHALDRAIAISRADRVPSAIACPPDGVCVSPLRSGKFALNGTEIVGASLGTLAASIKPRNGSWNVQVL